MDILSPPVKIHSGLTHFILPESITRADPKEISGICRFDDAAAWLALEACAQICALHVRYHRQFEGHAFLMKINGFSMPSRDRLTGVYPIHGRVKGRSDRAVLFDAALGDNGAPACGGQLIIATRACGPHETRLKAHYKGVFSCLAGG